MQLSRLLNSAIGENFLFLFILSLIVSLSVSVSICFLNMWMLFSYTCSSMVLSYNHFTVVSCITECLVSGIYDCILGLHKQNAGWQMMSDILNNVPSPSTEIFFFLSFHWSPSLTAPPTAIIRFGNLLILQLTCIMTVLYWAPELRCCPSKTMCVVGISHLCRVLFGQPLGASFVFHQLMQSRDKPWWLKLYFSWCKRFDICLYLYAKLIQSVELLWFGKKMPGCWVDLVLLKNRF